MLFGISESPYPEFPRHAIIFLPLVWVKGEIVGEDPRTLQRNEVSRNIERSQGPIPYWMVVLTILVYSVAIILSLPLFGDRKVQPGQVPTFLNQSHTRPWIDYGTVAGGAYLAIGFFVIYYVMMVRPRKRNSQEDQD